MWPLNQRNFLFLEEQYSKIALGLIDIEGHLVVPYLLER